MFGGKGGDPMQALLVASLLGGQNNNSKGSYGKGESGGKAPGQNVCWNYQQYGSCRNGDSCRFQHVSNALTNNKKTTEEAIGGQTVDVTGLGDKGVKVVIIEKEAVVKALVTLNEKKELEWRAGALPLANYDKCQHLLRFFHQSAKDSQNNQLSHSALAALLDEVLQFVRDKGIFPASWSSESHEEKSSNDNVLMTQMMLIQKQQAEAMTTLVHQIQIDRANSQSPELLSSARGHATSMFTPPSSLSSNRANSSPSLLHSRSIHSSTTNPYSPGFSQLCSPISTGAPSSSSLTFGVFDQRTGLQQDEDAEEDEDDYDEEVKLDEETCIEASKDEDMPALIKAEKSARVKVTAKTLLLGKSSGKALSSKRLSGKRNPISVSASSVVVPSQLDGNVVSKFVGVKTKGIQLLEQGDLIFKETPRCNKASDNFIVMDTQAPLAHVLIHSWIGDISRRNVPLKYTICKDEVAHYIETHFDDAVLAAAWDSLPSFLLLWQQMQCPLQRSILILDSYSMKISDRPGRREVVPLICAFRTFQAKNGISILPESTITAC